MTFRVFRDLIAGLHHIEFDQLVAAGIIPDKASAWFVFRQRPSDFFLTLPDDLAAKLFALAQGRDPLE